MYTLDPQLAAAAKRARLRTLPGYFMLWATGHGAREWEALISASWCLQSGDRL
jgi:hypothetical protein